MIGELLPPDNPELLSERATFVDKQLEKRVEEAKVSVTEICEFLAEIKDKKLWTYLTNPATKKAFESPEKYASYRLEPLRLGPMRKSKFYEMTAVATLTKGENALSEEDVEKLGLKKAAAVARLPAHKRTKQFVEAAKESSLTQLNQAVQEELNEDLPEEERKEATCMFTRTLAYSVVSELEKLEAVGIFMTGVNNADRSVSRESKFWGCVVIAMNAYYKEELIEARKAKEKAEAKVNDQASQAAAAQ